MGRFAGYSSAVEPPTAPVPVASKNGWFDTVRLEEESLPTSYEDNGWQPASSEESRYLGPSPPTPLPIIRVKWPDKEYKAKPLVRIE